MFYKKDNKYIKATQILNDEIVETHAQFLACVDTDSRKANELHYKMVALNELKTRLNKEIGS